jgi:hypothetical protein
MVSAIAHGNPSYCQELPQASLRHGKPALPTLPTISVDIMDIGTKNERGSR